MRRRLVVFILAAMMAITLGAMMTLPEDAVLETLEPLDDREIFMPSDPVAHTLNAAFGRSLCILRRLLQCKFCCAKIVSGGVFHLQMEPPSFVFKKTIVLLKGDNLL